jgi:DNA-binding transcriptional ArsR family regulator
LNGTLNFIERIKIYVTDVTDLTNPQQEILKILRESSAPIGPAAIACKLGFSKDTKRGYVHNHLKILKEKGIVICPKKGKYSIIKEEFEIVKELELKILELLAVKEYYPKELEEELGQDEDRVISAIYLLESYGLIKEGNISLTKRGGLPRKGLTTHVTDYFRASTYTPTYIGYSKIGLCPICKEELNNYEAVVVAFFRQTNGLRQRPWLSTEIHSKCLPESKAYNTMYGRHKPSMFCSHCGLPLSPKMLPEYSVDYQLLKDHFFSFELKSITLLEELIESWLVPARSPFFRERHAITPQNSTIRTVYKKLNLEVPGWLDERIKDDENNPEITPFGEICHEISNELMFTFDGDLSKLKITEKFQKLLIKYRSSCPEEYDVNSRIKEIWSAAQDIKKNYIKNIRTSYEKLLGPEANLYSHIDWALDPDYYDFDKAALSSRNDRDFTFILAQTFAIKCRDRYYHPYCADKLGLNDSHCNDNKPKGGEGIE